MQNKCVSFDMESGYELFIGTYARNILIIYRCILDSNDKLTKYRQ